MIDYFPSLLYLESRSFITFFKISEVIQTLSVLTDVTSGVTFGVSCQPMGETEFSSTAKIEQALWL